MGLHPHWRKPLLVNQITMLSCSARSHIVALGSSYQTYSSHKKCSLLSSNGLRALPLNIKPFRSDSRAHRISHRSHVTQAAIDISNVPQEALIAGGAGAMSCDPFPSKDSARNIHILTRRWGDQLLTRRLRSSGPTSQFMSFSARIEEHTVPCP